MNGITIAPASEADIPELIDLLAVLFSIEQDFSPDPDKQRRGLATLLASPTGHIAIARDTTSRAVGMATAQLVISTAEGAPSAWVEDVVVREDWRGQGLGRALLDVGAGLGAQHRARCARNCSPTSTTRRRWPSTTGSAGSRRGWVRGVGCWTSTEVQCPHTVQRAAGAFFSW
jgi:GNAT superfamily N-acetyltransferase